jgi:hypothetical protein
MSCHLSADQISALIAGTSTGMDDAAAHLDDCAECRNQVEQFESVLGRFRGSVREWSGTQFTNPIVVQSRKHVWPVMAYGWCAVLLVLFSVIGYRYSRPPVEQPVAESSTIDSDTVLLNRVKADVSRSAPPGMETLLGFAIDKSAR